MYNGRSSGYRLRFAMVGPTATNRGLSRLFVSSIHFLPTLDSLLIGEILSSLIRKVLDGIKPSVAMRESYFAIQNIHHIITAWCCQTNNNNASLVKFFFFFLSFAFRTSLLYHCVVARCGTNRIIKPTMTSFGSTEFYDPHEDPLATPTHVRKKLQVSTTIANKQGYGLGNSAIFSETYL